MNHQRWRRAECIGAAVLGSLLICAPAARADVVGEQPEVWVPPETTVEETEKTVTAPMYPKPAPVYAKLADDYDDSEAHPLRLIAYIVHPAGFALEWLVMKPIHFVVSQPDLEKVFGHRAHDVYTYDEDYL
jgi:hypothetical protein